MAARREPTFHSVGRADDHHAPVGAVHLGQPIKSGSHFTRFISGFQAISTLIGVPLALASGYTLYRTNYAPETGCANLRASIVSMLDKNVDPATRRMLVKRDVEAFEQRCGGFDPDAQAAFKALLATEKGVAQVAPTAKVAPKPAAPVIKEAAKEPPKEIAKEATKVELRPTIVDKKPVAVVAQPEPVAQDAPMTDARWLDAVRNALTDQTADAGERPRKAAPPEPLLQPNWSVSAPAAQPIAQSAVAPLPPAVAVSDVQRTTPADPNRPVPPASIPAAQYANGGANSGSWVAQIPFVGRMIDRSGN
ncbi:hypothetical protein [Undibacter mobilis]|uniref:Uncharacterized protein n=1 Tax=Undibacter mobilis TaxID=2292256 RepID=A0A371B2W5_9BRAD|nr:hypothetical protein [Undibacter mobilis]RDV01890.1 hypothetical protein DXH78_14855 [Undibacter mobilis]